MGSLGLDDGGSNRRGGSRRSGFYVSGFETGHLPEGDVVGEPVVADEEVSLPTGGDPAVDVDLKVVDEDGAARIVDFKKAYIARALPTGRLLSGHQCGGAQEAGPWRASCARDIEPRPLRGGRQPASAGQPSSAAMRGAKSSVESLPVSQATRALVMVRSHVDVHVGDDSESRRMNASSASVLPTSMRASTLAVCSKPVEPALQHRGPAAKRRIP